MKEYPGEPGAEFLLIAVGRAGVKPGRLGMSSGKTTWIIEIVSHGVV